MKILSLFLLLFSVATTTFAQDEGARLTELCKNFSLQELEKGLNELQEQSTEEVKYKWLCTVNREIVDGYFEQVFELTKSVKHPEKEGTSTLYFNKVKLVSKDTSIIYFQITEQQAVKEDGRWVPFDQYLAHDADLQEFDKLKITYIYTYRIDLDMEALFEREIVYGTRCGYAGSEPLYRQKVNQLISTQDLQALIQWLKSPQVEIQLYAIDGILTLKEQGVYVEPWVLGLIETIGKKQGTAYTCSGCNHWNQPISEIVEQIKASH